MKEYKHLEAVKGKNWDEICQHMFKEDLMKDITFLFDENGKFVTLKAHKLFLSLRSPVFHTMFYGSLAMSASPGQEIKEISISDVESTVFSILLKFIYSFDDLSNANVGDIKGLERAKLMIDILYAAKKYLLKDIEETLIKHINSNMDYSNAYYYLKQIKFFDGIDQGVCQKVLAQNGSEFSKTTSFLEMTREDLLAFLLDDNTDVYEGDLVKATLAWAKHNTSQPRTGLLAGSQIRATLGEDIIKAIRYPLLEATDFHQLIVRPGILKSEEIIEILLKLLKIPDSLGSIFCAKPRYRKNTSRPYVFGDLVVGRVLATNSSDLITKMHRFCFRNPGTVIIKGLCLLKSVDWLDCLVKVNDESRKKIILDYYKLHQTVLLYDTKYEETYFAEPLILNIEQKDTIITFQTFCKITSNFKIQKAYPIELESNTIIPTTECEYQIICGLII